MTAACMQNGLSGAWTGRYDYDGFGPATAFSAWLVDEGGTLRGECVEQNTFARIASDTLMSGLAGDRTGLEVAVTKRYSDFEQPAVQYQGLAAPEFDTITGIWLFPESPWIRGRFMMVRERRRAKVRQRQAEQTR